MQSRSKTGCTTCWVWTLATMLKIPCQHCSQLTATQSVQECMHAIVSKTQHATSVAQVRGSSRCSPFHVWFECRMLNLLHLLRLPWRMCGQDKLVAGLLDGLPVIPAGITIEQDPWRACWYAVPACNNQDARPASNLNMQTR